MRRFLPVLIVAAFVALVLGLAAHASAGPVIWPTFAPAPVRALRVQMAPARLEPSASDGVTYTMRRPLTDPWFVGGLVAIYAAPAFDQIATRRALNRGHEEIGCLHGWGGTPQGYALQAAVNTFIAWGCYEMYPVHPRIAKVILWTTAAAYTTAGAVNWSRR